jgi:hypothetical protein
MGNVAVCGHKSPSREIGTGRSKRRAAFLCGRTAAGTAFHALMKRQIFDYEVEIMRYAGNCLHRGLFCYISFPELP